MWYVRVGIIVNIEGVAIGSSARNVFGDEADLC